MTTEVIRKEKREKEKEERKGKEVRTDLMT